MSETIPVLMYHRVLREPSRGPFDTWVLASAMRRQLEHLRRAGIDATTFRDLERPAPPGRRRVILTFDDGYLDNYTTLFPLLQEFGARAVVFMVTGRSSNTWDVPKGEPEQPLMTPAQAREMAAHGIEFGGHTRHHVSLEAASPEVARDEVRGCKADLEDWLGVSPVSFAYPYGASPQPVRRAVEEAGFRWGVATKSGPLQLGEDRYRVRRLAISHRTGMLTFRLKAGGRYHLPLHGLLYVPGMGRRGGAAAGRAGERTGSGDSSR